MIGYFKNIIFGAFIRDRNWQDVKARGMRLYNGMPRDGFRSIEEAQKYIDSEPHKVTWQWIKRDENHIETDRNPAEVHSEICFRMLNEFRNHYGENDGTFRNFFIRENYGDGRLGLLFVNEKLYSDGGIRTMFSVHAEKLTAKKVSVYSQAKNYFFSFSRTRWMKVRAIIGWVLLSLMALTLGISVFFQDSFAGGVVVCILIFFPAFFVFLKPLFFDDQSVEPGVSTGGVLRESFSGYSEDVRQWAEANLDDMEGLYRNALRNSQFRGGSSIDAAVSRRANPSGSSPQCPEE